MVKDRLLAQGSGAFLVLGSTTIFLAASWVLIVVGQVLCSLGDIVLLPARGLASAMVDQSHLGTLFTALEVFNYVGVLIGGPLLASTFKWGMKLGQSWVGLPFLMAAIFFLIATLILSTALWGITAPANPTDQGRTCPEHDEPRAARQDDS